MATPKQANELRRVDLSNLEYRSLNRQPTALGIERKLCIFGGMLALIRLHTGGGLTESAADFGIYWLGIFFLTRWEPRLLQMLPDLWRQRRFYSALKVK